MAGIRQVGLFCVHGATQDWNDLWVGLFGTLTCDWDGIHNQDLPSHLRKTYQGMHWSQGTVYCSHLARVNASYLASWWPANFACFVPGCGHYSSVKTTEWTIQWPSHTGLSELNSTKLQYFSLDPKFLGAHFSAKVWVFSQPERFRFRRGDLTFKIINPLHRMCHKAFCDGLEPSAVDEINLLCQWCSRVCRHHNLQHPSAPIATEAKR